MAALVTESYTLQPTSKNSDNTNIIFFEAAPGTTVENSLTVGNLTEQAITLHLYPADMVRTSDGGEVSKNPNIPQESIGKWITLDNADITLQPHQSMVVPFHATIPADTALKNYTGAIVATNNSGAYYDVAPGVKASTRLALKTEVNVTAHPKPTRPDNVNVFGSGSFFASSYFWISLIFFIGSTIYFVYTGKRGKTN